MLQTKLIKDYREILEILEIGKNWNPDEDRQLNALCELVTEKHKDEKVLIFTQFADTAYYLNEQLNKRGLKQVECVTGDTESPTDSAHRFSPRSKIIPDLPNVIYATKENTRESDKEGVIVYTKTAEDNDVLAWLNKDGEYITQSQYTILKAAAAIPVSLAQNPKDFQMPDNVFNYHALRCQSLVELFLLSSQLAAFRFLKWCPRVFVQQEQTLITAVRQTFDLIGQIRFAVFRERKIVSCAFGKSGVNNPARLRANSDPAFLSDAAFSCPNNIAFVFFRRAFDR